MFRWDDGVEDGPADDLGARVPEQCLGTLVPREDRAVRRNRDQRTEQLLRRRDEEVTDEAG
jgi:hypothetical protein